MSRRVLPDDFDFDHDQHAAAVRQQTHTVSHRRQKQQQQQPSAGRPGSAGVARSHTIGPAPMAEQMYAEMAAEEASSDQQQQQQARSRSGSSSANVEIAPLNQFDNSSTATPDGRSPPQPQHQMMMTPRNHHHHQSSSGPAAAAAAGGSETPRGGSGVAGVPPLSQPPRSARQQQHQQQQENQPSAGSSYVAAPNSARRSASQQQQQHDDRYFRLNDPRPRREPSSSGSATDPHRGVSSRQHSLPPTNETPNDTEISTFQRTMDMLTALSHLPMPHQHQQQQQQQRPRQRPRSADHYRTGHNSHGMRPMSSYHQQQTAPEYFEEVEQPHYEQAGGGTFGFESGYVRTSPGRQQQQQQFGRRNQQAPPPPVAAATMTMRRPGSARSSSSTLLPGGGGATSSATLDNSTASSSYSSTMMHHHQQPQPHVAAAAAAAAAAPSSLFLEETQSELERVSTEKHELQRVIIELQQENAALRAESETTGEQLDVAREHEAELAATVVELQQQLEYSNSVVQQQQQAGEAAADEQQQMLHDDSVQRRLNLEQQQQQQQQQQDRRQRDVDGQHLQFQGDELDCATAAAFAITSTSPAAVEAAVEKALFVMEGNFDRETIKSLMAAEEATSKERNDNEEGQGRSVTPTAPAASSVDVAELINFLSDRVVELFAAHTQLAAHADTAAEMEQLAQEWEEHEGELSWRVADAEARVRAEQEEVARLKREIAAMEEAVPESVVAVPAAPAAGHASPSWSDVAHQQLQQKQKQKQQQEQSSVVIDSKFERDLKKQLMSISDGIFAAAAGTDNSQKQQQRSGHLSSEMDNLVHEAEGELARVREMLYNEKQKLAQAREDVANAEKQQEQQQQLQKQEHHSPAVSASKQKRCRWSDVPSLVVEEESTTAATTKTSRSRVRFTSRDLSSLSFDAATLAANSSNSNSKSSADSTAASAEVFVSVVTAVAASWGIIPPTNGFFCTAVPRRNGRRSETSNANFFDAAAFHSVVRVIASCYHREEEEGSSSSSSSATARGAPFHNGLHAANVCQALHLMLEQQDDECCNVDEAMAQREQERAERKQQRAKKEEQQSGGDAAFDNNNEEEEDTDIVLPNPAMSLIRNMDTVERLALLLSAAACCISHPGRTDQHLVRVRDPIAVRYSNNHVLAHFHVATLLEILLVVGNGNDDGDGDAKQLSSPCPLLQGLDDDDVSRFQRLCLGFMLGVAQASTPHAFAESLWGGIESGFGIDDEVAPAESLGTRQKILAWLLHAAQQSFAVRSDAAVVDRWMQLLAAECEQQQKEETALGFKTLSSDVAIRMTSADAKERSTVWLYDGVVLPAMVLADALIHPLSSSAVSASSTPPVISFSDAAASVRNVVATKSRLPTVDARELKRQCRAMMKIVNHGGGGSSLPSSPVASLSATPAKKQQHAPAAAVSSAVVGGRAVTEADVEAMKWSFAEVQRSLLETISEYQHALAKEMEEKRVLAEAAARISKVATPHLAEKQGTVSRSAEL